MATTSLNDVRTALKRAIKSQTGVPVVDYTENPPSQAFLVRRTATTPRSTFTGKAPIYTFTITAITPKKNLGVAQAWIDSVVSRSTSRSLYDALEADKTIGGTCQTIYELGDFGPDMTMTFGQVDYVGAEVTVALVPTAT